MAPHTSGSSPQRGRRRARLLLLDDVRHVHVHHLESINGAGDDPPHRIRHLAQLSPEANVVEHGVPACDAEAGWRVTAALGGPSRYRRVPSEHGTGALWPRAAGCGTCLSDEKAEWVWWGRPGTTGRRWGGTIEIETYAELAKAKRLVVVVHVRVRKIIPALERDWRRAVGREEEK